MSLLREIAAELLKMFLADARLTGAVLLLVGVVVLLVDVGNRNPLIGGAVLVAGCLLILVATTAIGARRR